MAPPTVLTYLRNHSRRTGSSPQSPQSPQWGISTSSRGDNESARPPSVASLSFKPAAAPSSPADSPLSTHPPSLPPIPRVASTHESDQKPSMASNSNSNFNAEKPLQPLASNPPVLPPIPRVTTRKQPYQEPLRIKTIDSKPETGLRRKGVVPVQVQTPKDQHEDSQSSSQDRTSYLAPNGTEHSQPSGNSHSSSSSQNWYARPSTPPPSTQSNNELLPPLNNTSRRASSPASSLSSLPKSATSSNAPIESSPGSSRSTAQPVPPAPIPSRIQKSRMNLLNPVSLLRRRRTSQNTEQTGDASFIGHNLDVPAMGLPEDYDPRIKGKGVHDFNAPRPRRHHSTNAAGLGIQITGDASPVEEYRRRSSIPAPAEDLEVGTSQPKTEDSKGRENDRAPIFVERFDDEDQDRNGTSGAQRESLANSSFLARMSRKLDFDSPEFNNFKAPNFDNQQRPPTPAGERTSKSTVDAPSIRVSSEQTTARSSISNDTNATSPSGSPGSRQQRKSLTLDAAFQPEGMPQHYPSTASRTSRFSFQLNSEATQAQERELEEKGKEREAKARRSMDDDDDRGFDSDDDDVTNYDDMESDPYEEPIPMVNVVDDPNQDDDEEVTRVLAAEVPNLSDEHADVEPLTESTGHLDSEVNESDRQMTFVSDKSDSFYFDDGMIGHPSPSASQPFDESFFDSPVESKEGVQSLTESFVQPHDSDRSDVDLRTNAEQNDEGRLSGLEAYHDALANAATKAEANGRFRRDSSVETSTSDQVHDVKLQDSTSLPFPMDHVQMYQPVFEDSDLDGFEDDPMIAAANAEVLASEDSEFYGREFGFYGGLPVNDDDVFNGGHFRSSIDDLNHTASVRNVCREPNLTPITERSEFSTRNSFTSLHGWGSNPSAPNSAISRADGIYPNPGLKDLVSRMSMDEDDMTLSQLMKLRKQTFGRNSGSTGDASPSASFRSESPLTLQSTLNGPVMEEETPRHHNRARSSSTNDNVEISHVPHSSSSPHALVLSDSPQASLQTPTFPNSSETTPRPLSALKAKNMMLPHEIQGHPSPTHHPPPLIGNLGSHVQMPNPPFAFPAATSSAPSSPINTGSSAMPIPFPNFTKHQASNSAPLHMPIPPPELIQKFANRPPASSASYAERERQRNSMGTHTAGSHGGKSNGSSDSVAYVREDSKWYLERRRRLSGGEFVIIGRELVEGGRI